MASSTLIPLPASPCPAQPAPALTPSSLPNPQSPLPPSDFPLPPSTLPLLSAPDETLLETYIALSFNLDLLAQHTEVPILRLIRWANLPHIAEYLKVIEGLHLRQAAAEDRADRRAAIDALKQILDTTQDPIERRRASTTILRTINTKTRLPLPEAADPPRRRGGRGVVSPDSPTASNSSAPPGRSAANPSPNPQSEIANPQSKPSPAAPFLLTAINLADPNTG